MDKEFKQNLENRIRDANAELENYSKGLDFYKKIEQSSFGKSISKMSGNYKNGFILKGNDYSVVNDFRFSRESANRYDFLSDSTVSLVGKINFFNNNLFENFKAEYKLIQSKKDEELQMDVLYVLNVDDTDYSGTPGFAMAPYFSFPKKIEEIKEFYLSRGMNEDFVLRVIENIKNIRSVL